MPRKGEAVTIGDVKEINVTGFSHNGEGVGRADGLAVFVPQAIPGERVRVRIEQIKSNFARGCLQEVVTASPDRTWPPCPVFGICGGCQLQHILYSRQLELKRELVAQALKRIARIDNSNVLLTAGMENPWRYRNKGQFHAGKMNDRVVFGFYKPGSYELVPARDCLLFSSAVNSLVLCLEDILSEAGVEVYDPKTGTGWLRNLVIRASSVTGEVMAVLVTADARTLPSPIWKEILAQFPELVSVYQNVNRTSGPVVMGPTFFLLHGKPTITDRIGHLSFEISPGSFFQVNSLQTAVLYQFVQDMAGLDGSQVVIDAYSGVGTIGLYLAQRARKVIGIESDRKAVADAEVNAKQNGITNVEFIAARVEDWIDQKQNSSDRIDVVVLDPPRRGANAEFLEALAKIKPARLIYVSCNPATLARDLGYLLDRGYRTTQVQPIDMFPQTAHVECVVLLENGVV